MANAKTVSVPVDSHAALSPTEEDDGKLSNVPYREAVDPTVVSFLSDRIETGYRVCGKLSKQILEQTQCDTLASSKANIRVSSRHERLRYQVWKRR